jgi:hypothetical protein
MKMSQEGVKRIDKESLPWYYRVILKIPVPEINLLQSSWGGLFWLILLLLFLALEFFLNLILLVFLSFPINVILVAIIPSAVFIMFVRINLERFISWWNSACAESGFKWNLDKSVQEYLDSIEEKEEDKT